MVDATLRIKALLEKIIAAVIVKTFLTSVEARWFIDHHCWPAL
jgi:hypothetical protein